MTDIEELERLHAATSQGEWTVTEDDGIIATNGPAFPVPVFRMPANLRAIAATHNVLPGVIAELKTLRSLRDEFAKYCGNTPACRFRPVDVTVDGKIITVMNSADSHRLGAIADELAALREVAEAARRFVPAAEESAVFAPDARTRHLIAALAKVPT